ncbi:hypothetical protein RA25_13745 [Leisingera sp. ANG-S5]|nr:hypothetical protein RA25_13745 [Leisingera sp. ANG-S5]
MRASLEEALYFGLGGETTSRKALQGLSDSRGKRLIGDENLAATTFGRDVFVADWSAENPEPVFNARLHLLHDLSAILFALKFSLSRDNRFNEFAFGRILKFKVQAFNQSAARLEGLAQLNVHFGLTRKPLEIVKDHNVVLFRLSIEVAEKRHHAWTFHEVTASRCIIGKDGFYFIALGLGIGTAALLLAFQTATIQLLFGRGHPAVNDCFELGALHFLFMFHRNSFFWRSAITYHRWHAQISCSKCLRAWIH